MKNFSEEQLSLIEEMAYLLISPSLIAVNLGMLEADLRYHLKDETSPVYQAFYKGLLRQKMELHRSIIKAAGNGSNPAQEQLKAMVRAIETDIG